MVLRSSHASHDEQWLHLETLVEWPQAFGVVMLLYIDQFFRSNHCLYRHVVIAAILQHDQSSMHPIQQKVESEIAERHGYNRVDGVWIAASHEIAQLLVHNVHRLAVVVFR